MNKVLAVLFAVAATSAEAVIYDSVDGYTWLWVSEYNDNRGYPQWAKITGVSPAAGDIVVPSTMPSYDGVRVGQIEGTFLGSNCPDVTSLSLPGNIFILGPFNGCVNITNVTVRGPYNTYDSPIFPGDKIQSICWAGERSASGAFTDAGKRNITDIEVFPGTTNITAGAFYGFDGVVRVSIPNGVESVGKRAFAFCSSLKDVTISFGVGSIGEAAFANCASIREITIPASVTNMDASVFRQCYGLQTVTFEGDAPTCPYPVFDMANKDLVVRVKRTSKGWNGDAKSSGLPDLWPQNNEAGRRIMYVGETLDEEPCVYTNYVFTTITNHVYHHDVVTDMTAYHTTVTNVHVHVIQNPSQSQFLIPQGYDTGFVNVIGEVKGGFAVIPATWSVNYPGFTERFGSDFSKALSKPTGKFDRQGNPMYVWQDFVAGTNPLDQDDVFTASISVVNGKVDFSYTPVLDADRTALRKYSILAKRSLLDSKWEEIEIGDAVNYNFFKLTVEMR